jgi:repressor LexA
LRVTRKGVLLLKKYVRGAEEEQEYASEDNENAVGRRVDIPLAGKVAAGVPIEAVEDNEKIALDMFGSADDIFALEVCGDSMNGEGIFEGDYIVCKKCQTARNGDIVVAIVDDESAAVKRFYREKSMVKLVSANEKYEPIFTENCRIEAVVTGLIRKM